MVSADSTSRPTEAWIRRMADAEDRCESVAVGGLAHDVGMLRPGGVEYPRVFGRFIGLARRGRGLSIEQLATTADVDLGELVALECDMNTTPTPRTVYQLAKVLRISTEKLLVVAGLAEPEDESLKEATLLFAARSEPTAQLSKVEREALDEFVKVLVERSDGK